MAVVLCLTGCSGAQGGASSASGAKVEQKTYPFTFQKKLDAAPEESEMNLYFVNDGDVPYVALSEYLPFFGKIYEDDKLGTKALEFDIEQANGVYTATRANTPWAMAVDPKADTIDFIDYNAFKQSPGDTALVSLVTIGENGLDEHGLLVDSGSSYDRRGLLTQFDLSNYEIDLVEANGECYLPLQTMQDILLSSNYMLTVFNGEKVSCSLTGQKA